MTRVVSAGPNAGTRTTWMLHPDNLGGLSFESEVAPNGTVSNRHYLSVGGLSLGVLETTGALPTLLAGQLSPNTLSSVTSVKLEYWNKDQLGSLMATSDHLGNVTARYRLRPLWQAAREQRPVRCGWHPGGGLDHQHQQRHGQGLHRP